jgi:hypothetical protein
VVASPARFCEKEDAFSFRGRESGEPTPHRRGCARPTPAQCSQLPGRYRRALDVDHHGGSWLRTWLAASK